MFVLYMYHSNIMHKMSLNVMTMHGRYQELDNSTLDFLNLLLVQFHILFSQVQEDGVHTTVVLLEIKFNELHNLYVIPTIFPTAVCTGVLNMHLQVRICRCQYCELSIVSMSQY